MYKAYTGPRGHSSILTQSLCCPPSRTHSVPFCLLAEPLVPAGPSQDLPPPPLPASLPASKTADSAAGVLDCCWKSGRFVCSRARREISTINGQQRCRRLQHRSALLWQGWQLGIGRQAWHLARLGAELQASLGLLTWGLGLRGAEGMGGSPECPD